MIRKKAVLFPLVLFCAGFCLLFAQSRPTSSEDLLKMGVGLFGESRFAESATILRLIRQGDPYYAEALYWLSLSDLSGGNYNQALASLEILEKIKGPWTAEIPYHRGRCLFYLGNYEEAMVNFGKHLENSGDGDLRKSASWYWIGECLFALGRLDSAADAFAVVMEQYPHSVKYEAAYYRLDLINQKKIENELLSILKWSHEETLRSQEEYIAREKAYNQAIAEYQRRLDIVLSGTSLQEENTEGFRDQTAMQMRIAALEASLAEANRELQTLRGDTDGYSYNFDIFTQDSANDARSYTDSDRARRILELRGSIIELREKLNANLSGE